MNDDGGVIGGKLAIDASTGGRSDEIAATDELLDAGDDDDDANSGSSARSISDGAVADATSCDGISARFGDPAGSRSSSEDDDAEADTEDPGASIDADAGATDTDGASLAARPCSDVSWATDAVAGSTAPPSFTSES